MPHQSFSTLGSEKRVEPVRRMVGGRFGWAFHRFPIKGGITPMHAHSISIMETLARQSYFASKFQRIAP